MIGFGFAELNELGEIKVQESDTARVEDMVKEYFSKANDVSNIQKVVF
jgi:hypothetical protein